VFLAVSLALTTAVGMQSQAAPPAGNLMVLLDPARGGTENGALVADRVNEKQTTLKLALRIGFLLKARGFNVEMTRSSDIDVSNDVRAALANTTHPIACVLLHATGTGTGVHLYTTTLHQSSSDSAKPVSWDDAQGAYADRSHALAEELLTAFTRAKLPVSSGQTWVRPLDNMQCPAIAVEMSPMKDGTAADDETYQGHVADVIAGAMIFWRGQVERMVTQPAVQPAAPSAGTATPAVAGRTLP
jgi:N-acetylmuramoyl-L-alanine amidase